MATKQKSGLYRTKIKIGVGPDGKDIVKWISARTKKDLEERKREVIAYYIDGEGMAADQLFGPYAIEWFRTFKQPHISKSTLNQYRSFMNRHVLPAFGDRRIRAIRSTELQQFADSLAGKSESEIGYTLAILRNVFQRACVDRILKNNPMDHVTTPPHKAVAEKRPLTPEERQKLEQLCVTHPYGPFLACMYYLGVRPGEARGLMWGDFDWTANTVHIQRDVDHADSDHFGKLKTKSSDRIIPVPDSLRRILFPLRGLPNALLFQGIRPGRPWSEETFRKRWVELMLAVGLVEKSNCSGYKKGSILNEYRATITPHYLRHNFITMCYENGLDPYTTMKLVGHADIQTTMKIYTHFSDQQLQKTAQKLNDMFSVRD